MLKGFLSNIHPFGKLILALLVAFSVMLFFFLIGILVAVPLFHIDVGDLQTIATDITHVENINILKFFQISQSLGLFVIPPFIIAWFIASSIMEYLGLAKKPLLSSCIAGIAIILIGLPVINYLGELNNSMKLPDFLNGLENWMKDTETEFALLTERLLEAKNISTLLLNIFMIAIIPAVGEELAFRGILQQLFVDWFKNKHWGVIVTAFVFSAIHFQFYGFIPRFALGLYLGYLFVWSGSLWLPMITHFANNFIAVIFYYLAGKNMIDKNVENYGAEGSSIYATLISAVVISGLLMILWRNERQRSVYM